MAVSTSPSSLDKNHFAQWENVSKHLVAIEHKLCWTICSRPHLFRWWVGQSQIFFHISVLVTDLPNLPFSTPASGHFVCPWSFRSLAIVCFLSIEFWSPLDLSAPQALSPDLYDVQTYTCASLHQLHLLCTPYTVTSSP